jgi:hypothetical protein
VELTGE